MTREVELTMRVVELLQYEMQLSAMSRITVDYLANLIHSGKLPMSEAEKVIEIIEQWTQVLNEMPKGDK